MLDISKEAFAAWAASVGVKGDAEHMERLRGEVQGTECRELGTHPALGQTFGVGLDLRQLRHLARVGAPAGPTSDQTEVANRVALFVELGDGCIDVIGRDHCRGFEPFGFRREHFGDVFVVDPREGLVEGRR